MKRICTNSMITTFKRCKMKYVHRYMDELVPITRKKSLLFGDLFHRLIAGYWNGLPLKSVADEWRREIIESSEKHARIAMEEYGIHEEDSAWEIRDECKQMIAKCFDVYEYYQKNVLEKEDGRFEPVFVEETFNVPLVTIKGRAHPMWCFSGKYDIILRDTLSGDVFIRDYKTTSLDPIKLCRKLEFNTQAIGYFYSAIYLSILGRKQSVTSYFPYWPDIINTPRHFELDIIRKKVPKEPPLLKSGRLSKAKNIDTTRDLYLSSIRKNGLNPADYSDILNQLTEKESSFMFRQRIAISSDDLRRWMKETLACLRDIRSLELDRSRAYRADPSTCMNQYGSICQYHTLCFGDYSIARKQFKAEPRHSEL